MNAEARERIRWERIPRQVALSMAFERELPSGAVAAQSQFPDLILDLHRRIAGDLRLDG